MHKLRDKAAFTLLEVLISLVIVGISLGVVFETLSQSKRISWKSDEAAEASRVAHNLLVNSRFIKDALDSGGAQGTIKDGTIWHYRVEVSPLVLKVKDDTPRQIPGMVQFKLCVSRGEDRAGKRFCLTRWYRE